MNDQNDTIQHRWFKEVWDKGRAEAIDEMMSPDAIGHGLVDESGNEIRGAEAFKSFYKSFRGAFPDIRVIVEDTVSEGDKIVARCTVRATHTGEGIGLAPTNQPVDITGLCMVRVEGGRIAESWNEFDFMKLYRQIGALPGVEMPKDSSLPEEYKSRDGKLTDELFDSASALHPTEPEYEKENTPEENKAMMHRWFEEVWNQGREDAVAEMFAPDGIAYGLAGSGDEPVRGPAGFKAHYRSVRAALPDITITVEDTVADGDKIAARCVVRGTHTGEGLGVAATNKPVEITGLLISRIKGGKTVECWNSFDLLGLYRQMGAL